MTTQIGSNEDHGFPPNVVIMLYIIVFQFSVDMIWKMVRKAPWLIVEGKKVSKLLRRWGRASEL